MVTVIGPTPPRDRGYVRGLDAHALEIDVSRDFAIEQAVDAHIDDYCARLDHLRNYQSWHPAATTRISASVVNCARSRVFA